MTMEYGILKEDTATGLVEAVRAFIGRGWTPLGGPFAVLESGHDAARPYFYQAITKPTPKGQTDGH